MSIRLLSARLFNHGRFILQNYCKRNIHSNILENRRARKLPIALKKVAERAIQPQNRSQGLLQIGQHARKIFIDNVLNRVTNPVSADLRAQASKKLLYGDSAPFFALVGVSLATGNGLLTREEELEGVCWEIREAVNRYQTSYCENEDDTHIKNELDLDKLDIGSPIDKGCSAVVYAAAFKNQEKIDVEKSTPIGDHRHSMFYNKCQNFNDFICNVGDSMSNLSLNTSSSKMPQFSQMKATTTQVEANQPVFDKIEIKITSAPSEEEETDASVNNISKLKQDKTELNFDPTDSSIEKYPLALKMMFNYDIQSNAMAILKAMFKETLPARNRNIFDTQNWEKDIFDQSNQLPAHPNIVHMLGVFCAQIPDLKFSSNLYPMALPTRLNPNGYGRNMSLFLLMKRYHFNLRDFLKKYVGLDTRTRILLLAQLLEAIAHINRYGVAHRDLKSDNILIENCSDASPLLVVSDFGCCLADKNRGLVLPYSSNEIDKGGNTALMAPEIIQQTPGAFSVLNYTKSDLWTCGTLAYEIFGKPNPFYNDSKSNNINNADYKVTDLPDLGENVPFIIKKLVENILNKNPRKRLNPDVAANVMQLFLWAPSSWQSPKLRPSTNDILQWLLSLTTKILCEGAKIGRRNDTDYLLISSFLVRAQLSRVRKALNWIHSIK